MSEQYIIEPQRDTLKGTGPSVFSGGTWFVPCAEHEAEIWAVLRATDAGGEYELADDFTSRAAAENYIAARCIESLRDLLARALSFVECEADTAREGGDDESNQAAGQLAAEIIAALTA